jgi:heme exporter protein C
MRKAFPILGVLTAIFLSYALYLAMVVAPREQTMGDVQRIFYYHVPSAWTAFLLFFINFIGSIQYLVRRNPVSDKVANWTIITLAVLCCVGSVVVGVVPDLKAALPEGTEPSAIGTTGVLIAIAYFVVRKYFNLEAVFCTVVLVTGPLWARPVWGIWWTWDVRLTSTLVLWLIYVSYLILRRFSSSGQTPVMAAALAVFGALDVPLVYFSIWIFRTQHPQPVIGGGGSIDPRMLHVLLMNWLAFLCFAYLVCWSRYRLEIAKRELDEAQALESLQ